MRLLNLAQGEFLIGSVYLIVAGMGAFNVDPFLCMIGVLPIMFVIGYLIQRGLLQSLLEHSDEAPLVATFGLSIAAQAIFQLAYGPSPQAIFSPLGFTGVDILGHTVRGVSVLAFGLSIALTVAMQMLLKRTTFGTSLRAAAADPFAAQSLGVNVRHVFAICFGLGPEDLRGSFAP
jgi:branched-chain amino acid transport system permease protein